MHKLMLNKRGFTLVELLVVIVIIAILAAIIIPTYSAYVEKTKAQQAIVECRSVVVAGEAIALELFAKGKLSGPNSLAAHKAEIEDLAAIDGKVAMVLNSLDAKVTLLSYCTDKNIVVLYDPDETPAYSIEVGVVADAAISGKTDTTGATGPNKSHALQQAILDSKGKFTQLTAKEAALANYTGQDPLTWKPILASNGAVVMIASSSDKDGATNHDGSPAPNRMANLVYYNGSYYYHVNAGGKQDSNHVSDQNDFDADAILEKAPPAGGTNYGKDGAWIKCA